MGTRPDPFTRFGGIRLALLNLPEGSVGQIMTISHHIAILETQRDRIRRNFDLSHSKGLDGNAAEIHYYELLADVHLYVIAWANIGKSLRGLYKITDDAQLNWAYKRRKKWFEKMRLARNSLEHMDERILESDAFSVYGLVSVPTRSKAVICGIELDISEKSFDRIDALTRDLRNWVDKIPAKY